MLVLTRDLKDSTLLIGDDIEVKVVNVKGNQVRLAISAPDDVNIVRTELLPPEERPLNLPEVTAKPQRQRKPRSEASRGNEREERSDRRPQNKPRGHNRGPKGYREPRQLTPSHSMASEQAYVPKKEKVPVISLKRRRKISSADEESGE